MKKRHLLAVGAATLSAYATVSIKNQKAALEQPAAISADAAAGVAALPAENSEQKFDVAKSVLKELAKSPHEQILSAAINVMEITDEKNYQGGKPPAAVKAVKESVGAIKDIITHEDSAQVSGHKVMVIGSER